MKTATATYVAPFGDSKVVEMGGLTFVDGQSVELNSYDNPHLIEKLQGNQHFDVTVAKDNPDVPRPKAKRGRPSNADIAAAKAASEEADRVAKEAAVKAEEAKSDHEKISNAPESEMIRPPLQAPTADIKAQQAEATAHDFEKDRQAAIASREGIQATPPVA